ncbi:MAG TPA: tetratricopeptide repeat protein, partial [Candidatus Goldiibacteriota bacterium]|nr:tetratricopeptide repeat protein [Candidatus Goldiibacteriota bacterium]
PWMLYSKKNILHDKDSFRAYEEREVAGIYLFRMAQHYKAAGNKRLYEYLLDNAASVAYDSASALGNIAVIWSNDPETFGAPQKADELFNRALILDPRNDALAFNAGSFYAKMEVYERAAEMFMHAISLNPGNIMARIYLARVQEELKKKQEAAERQKELDADYNKAKQLLDSQKLDESFELFRKDAEKNPGLDRSYFHIALIYSMKNELEKAVPYYEKAIKANPKNYPALNNLGLCYYRLYKKDKALEAFKKSLALDPNQDRIKKMVEELEK